MWWAAPHKIDTADRPSPFRPENTFLYQFNPVRQCAIFIHRGDFNISYVFYGCP